MVKIWYSKVLERKIVTHFTTIPEQRLDYGEILSIKRIKELLITGYGPLTPDQLRNFKNLIHQTWPKCIFSSFWRIGGLPPYSCLKKKLKIVAKLKKLSTFPSFHIILLLSSALDNGPQVPGRIQSRP